jgi:hypothetical protein
MGDALKGRRLVVAAAVVVAVMAGVGAAAQAGLLSRAEAEGGTSTRGAGAAIGDGTADGDVIAVAETKASRDAEGNASASATLLRVGDTNIGEAPDGFSNPLNVLNGQPTEALIDGGCDNFNEPLPPACLLVLGSNVQEDGDFASGQYFVAEVRVGNTIIDVLASRSVQSGCSNGADAFFARTIDITTFESQEIDPSEQDSDCPQQ